MGAAIGNQNARKGRWAEALLRACEEEDPVTRKRFLDAIADKLREKAVAGDIAAIKEVGDRIDGKATQALEHSGPGGAPLPTTVEVLLTRPDKGGIP